MTTTISKRMRKIYETVPANSAMSVMDAFETLKKLSTVKFVESVDVSVNLGIDSKKTEQTVRGATVLPKGTGRNVRVAVMTQGAAADKAKKAGADVVGYEDLATAIKNGEFNFDVLIATPDAMPLVGKLGPVLGPRGMMPNPKLGTVTTDVERAVTNAKSGQVTFRIDKAGIIHCRIGTVKFSAQDLKENLEALMSSLQKARPSTAKGIFLKKITVSSTMGPGIVIDQNTLDLE